MVHAAIETTRSQAEVPHATSPQIATSRAPRNDGGAWWHCVGESGGARPLWQEVWRMCLHKLIFFSSPFLKGRGPGGVQTGEIGYT